MVPGREGQLGILCRCRVMCALDGVTGRSLSKRREDLKLPRRCPLEGHVDQSLMVFDVSKVQVINPRDLWIKATETNFRREEEKILPIFKTFVVLAQ